ncbi:hypothetical protein ACJA25_00845 [Mycoplasmopsis hyopharyngis]|uniref:hypothetical protein n=1 Tax=Mycoplasmopsis hyopharyngis TaxID=29558 RepID=UPI003872C4F0
MKKNRKSLLIFPAILISSASLALAISCKGTDFEKDITISWQKPKESILASQVQNYVSLGSKTKIVYTLQKVEFDDLEGKATLTILPGKNKVFTMSFTGFKKNINAFANHLKNVDLLEKEKHLVDDFITLSQDNLVNYIKADKIKNEDFKSFLKKHNVNLSASLKAIDQDAGVAELTLKLQLDSQEITKQYTIKDFKTILNSEEIDHIETLGQLSLKDADKTYAHEYENTKENLIKNLVNFKFSVEHFLTLKDIEISSISLINIDKNEGKGTLDVVFRFENTNHTMNRKYNVTFKKYNLSMDNVINELGELTLRDTNNFTTEGYKKSFKNSNLIFAGLKGKEIQKFIEEKIDLEIEPEFEVLDKQNGKVKLTITFRNKVTKETKAKSWEFEGFKKDKSSSEVLDKITKLDLEEKSKFSVDGFKHKFGNNLFDKLTSESKFDEDNIDIKQYLLRYGVDVKIDLQKHEATKAKLVVEITKDLQVKKLELELDGFKEEKTLQQVVDAIGNNLGFEDASTKTYEEYIYEYSKVIAEKITYDTNKKLKEETDSYGIDFEILVERIKGKSRDIKLYFTYKKNDETIKKEYLLTNVFKENAMLELFDTVLEDVYLEDCDKYNYYEFIKNPILKNKIRTKTKTYEEVIGAIKGKECDIYKIQILSFDIKTGSYFIVLTLKDKEGKVFSKGLQSAVNFKTMDFSTLLDNAPKPDLIDKSDSKVSEYITQVEAYNEHLDKEDPTDLFPNRDFTVFLLEHEIEIKKLALTVKDEKEGIGTLAITYACDLFPNQTITKTYDIAGFKMNLSFDEAIARIKDLDLKEKENHTIDSYNEEYEYSLISMVQGDITNVEIKDFLSANQIIITKIELKEKENDSTTGILSISLAKEFDQKDLTFEIKGFKENRLKKVLPQIGNFTLVDGYNNEDKYEFLSKYKDQLLSQVVSDKFTTKEQFENKLKELQVRITNVSLESHHKVNEGYAKLVIDIEDEKDPNIKTKITNDVKFKQITIDDILSKLGTLDAKDKDQYSNVFHEDFQKLSVEEKVKKLKATKDSIDVNILEVLEKYKSTCNIDTIIFDQNNSLEGKLTLTLTLRTEWNEEKSASWEITGFKQNPLFKIFKDKEIQLEGASKDLTVSQYKSKYTDLKTQIKTKDMTNQQLLEHIKTNGGEIESIELKYFEDTIALIIKIKETASPTNIIDVPAEIKDLKLSSTKLELVGKQEVTIPSNWKFDPEFEKNINPLEIETVEQNWFNEEVKEIKYDYYSNHFVNVENDHKLLKFKEPWAERFTAVNPDQPTNGDTKSNPKLKIVKSNGKIEIFFRFCEFRNKKLSSNVYKIVIEC